MKGERWSVNLSHSVMLKISCCAFPKCRMSHPGRFQLSQLMKFTFQTQLMSASTVWHLVRMLKATSFSSAPTTAQPIELGCCFTWSQSLAGCPGKTPTGFTGARIPPCPLPKGKMRKILCWHLWRRNRIRYIKHTQCRSASWGVTLIQGLFIISPLREFVVIQCHRTAGQVSF